MVLLKNLININKNSNYIRCIGEYSQKLKVSIFKPDITFTEFTSQLIRKYELYLTVDKGLSLNTLVRYMKVIKKVSTLALTAGLLKNDPFAGMRFKQPKTNPVFLTKEELDIITTKEFTLPRIAIVRDVFLPQTNLMKKLCWHPYTEQSRVN